MFTTTLNSTAFALRNTFRSLRYRNYRLFFMGQGISLIGTWVQRIATPWLVYHLTGSAFLLGLVGFVGQIPTFLIAPFAGVLTDRWNRLHIMIGAQIFSMIQALALAILYLSGHIQVWHVMGLSILLGSINAFDIPARQSFVVNLVEDKNDLPNAIALNSTMVNGARILGPSVAGLLIAYTGEGICFLINAFSYVFVIASLLMLQIKVVLRNSSTKNALQDFKDGLSYVFGSIPIRWMLILLALMSMMGMPYTVLMPVFAKEVLHGDSHTFGFLMGASGVGAMMGALYLASRKQVLGLFTQIPRAALVFGLSLILFSWTSYFWFSALLMVAVGLGMMVQMAATNTILQTISSPERRGRVMSFYTMAFMGAAPFGSFLAGFMAKYVGVPWTIALGGVFCVLGAMVFQLKMPHFRRDLAPVYEKLGLMSSKNT